LSINPLQGWLNILKPPGLTSHDVVAWARRLLGGKSAPKIGHTGTLDPAASGVLALCLGKATRLARYVEGQDKCYTFEMTFGRETDTLDAAGKITGETSRLPGPNEVAAALPGFIGEISQTPPAFSAVQVQGVRAYRLARKATPLTIPPRQVTISQLRLLDFTPGKSPAALLQVDCSKGTYIRSLCADIARALGSLAYVSFLCRRRAGKFLLEDSASLEEIQEDGLSKYLLPLDWPLDHLPELWLTEDQAIDFRQGRALAAITGEAATGYRVYAPPAGSFLGLGRQKGDCLQPEIVVLPTAGGDEEKI
jgi:tRNA pseudouridine55 synthase